MEGEVKEKKACFTSKDNRSIQLGGIVYVLVAVTATLLMVAEETRGLLLRFRIGASTIRRPQIQMNWIRTSIYR